MRTAIINITGGGMSGGYRKYLINMVPRIASNPEVEALLNVSPESINVQAWFDPISNVNFVNCQSFRLLHNSPDSQLRMHLEEFSPDVIFIPTERSLRFGKIPVVNMVQNMEPFGSNIDGNPVSERVRQLVQYINGRRTIKKADGVIALSKFVSDFLIKRWNIPKEKISLIYHGIDVSGNRDGDAQRPPAIPESWCDQFIFTAGAIRPARGLEDLLLAMKYLALQCPNTVKLVIAGETVPRMYGYHKELKDWIERHNLSSRVLWVGGLNEQEMKWCYQNCRLFVMTSRVESFGMIGGEAMSYGCICISADNPCLPELFRDGAVFYSPKDSQALAKTIKTVLIWDKNQRKVMSEKAKKQAAKFSWDVCAEKTIAFLFKVVRDFN